MLNSLNITDAEINAFLHDHNEGLEEEKRLTFCDERKEFIKGWNDVQACPGSGKTTLIAAKLLILAKKWTSRYQGICVLTHTNVACDEIRTRLESDPSGYKLLSYPHFIGTIQEFVDRFVAIPHIRSIRFPVSRIDDEVCETLSRKFINQGTMNYLERKHASVANLKLNRESGDFIIPGFQNESTSPTYNNLKSALDRRLCNGFFCFSEMYYFACEALKEQPDLSSSMQIRFPCVLIDEMQDTQKFQDELINKLFCCETAQIQRFGDPDQAIYDSMGNEEPNETFNNNPELETLAHSHRFSEDIAQKASKLSLNQIGEIQARGNPDPALDHTVFIYDDNTQQQVLEAFARLVLESDPNNSWKTVKAVGAVGQSENHAAHLQAYWGGYDRKKRAVSPKPEKLIDAVSRNWTDTDKAHSEHQYKLIVQTVLDALRIGNVMDERADPLRYFNQASLKSWLVDNGKKSAFRQLIADWIYSPPETEENWQEQIAKLRTIFNLPNNDEVNAFLAFSDEAPEPAPEANTSSNLFVAENDRSIDVATIHSVKGETHDATLILETKFKTFDIHQMLNHIAGLDTSTITKVTKKKFARQLYVAFSRPRHLLCFAVHGDHIFDEQRVALAALGWSIQVLEGGNNGR